jgi:peptidoglycan lytic transglycosylase
VSHRRLASFLMGFFLAAGASAAHAESGIASVYGGGDTASGELQNSSALTAAHRTLPFGTMVQVTNKNNGRSITVRINDRGPFTLGRVIDLTTAGAGQLGMSNLAPVDLTVLPVPVKSTLPKWLPN